MRIRQKRRLLAIATGALALIVGGVFVSKAFAYTVNNDLSAYGDVVQAYGGYTLMGGDSVKVSTNSPGPYPSLAGQTIHIAKEQANVSNMSETPDGQGNWGIMLADMKGADANNGYLFVASPSEGSPNAQDWVNRLGGNWSYVQNYLQSQSQQISTYDNSNYSSYTYVPFASVVSESGAKFGTKTITATGQTYDGYPVYQYTFPIYKSSPPQATGLSITDGNSGGSTITQGDPIDITANSTVWLWSGLASYHYDAVKITNNSTGHSQWIVGSGNTDKSQMQSESGGHGTFSDNLTSSVSSSSLSAGSYTASFWVADGVDRISSAAATASFSIAPSASDSGQLTLTPSTTSTTVGSSVTLTAQLNGQTVASDAAIITHDESGDNTLSGSNMYQGPLGQSTTSTTAVDNTAQQVEYVAKYEEPNGTIISSSPVYVTWSASAPAPQQGTPSITASANPSSTTSGQSSTISYSATDWQTGDYVTISGTGGTDTWSESDDTQSTGSYSETENPQNGNTTTVNYTFTMYNSSGQQVAETTTTATWTSSVPATSSLSLTANPTSTTVGSSTKLSVTVPPGPAGSVAPSGEYVEIYDESTGQIINGAYTGTSSFTYGFTNSGETETLTTSYSSNTAGSQTFVAYLWDAGVTPYNNAPNVTSNTQTVNWVQPSITMSASPQNVFSGESSQLSYTAVGLPTNGYVTISGTGGTNMWSESDDTQSTGSYSETETPTNGGTVTVQYVAQLHDSSGNVLASTTLTVTWSAPTLTMSANPQNNVPGQPSTISYSVNEPLPSGMTVSIIPSGNGTDMWNATGLTDQTGTDTETENPLAGGSIRVSYTGEVIDNATGQIMAMGSTSVNWTNPWTGSISLSASPQFAPTGSATTLTATTTQAVPSGWTLTITDQSTGQIVSMAGSAPETAKYTSYQAQTDTFIATLSDGYENVGNPSNTVQVVWSALALNANPTQLPTGQTSTLTVSGQNVPSGDYLVIENQSTGQLVGYSLSTPYSVSVSASTPQTDQYVAYISSETSPSGAYMSSNTVSVDWYGVTLTASPASLPTGKISTLTATAQNMPTGYELDIVNQTTGQVIASGQPGQTVLNALQMSTQVQTDHYIAQVVQPSNPSIPGLTVPKNQQIIRNVAIWGATDAAWNNGAADVNAVAATGVSYTTFTNPTQCDLSNFGAVLIESDEPTSFYQEVDQVMPQLNSWIQNGGTLILFAADHGWQDGMWPNNEVPAGLNNVPWQPANTDYVIDPNTPVTQNLPTEINGNYASHDYFDGYPQDAISYIDNGNSTQPVAISFPFGSGRVFASTQTLEYYDNGQGGAGYGTIEIPNIINYFIKTQGQGSVTDFPFWTFQQAPSYVPTSLFTQPAVASTPNYPDDIWLTANQSGNVPNGTGFFEGTFTLPTAENVTFSVPNSADDYEQVYVDGNPVLKYGFGTYPMLGGTAPYSTSETFFLPAGTHQVLIEGTNTNGFGSSAPNPAGVSLNVADSDGTVLSTSTPSEWMTTGYITQLPAGWFSGAIGTYNWTEYVLQENPSQPVYQQQSYSVTTSPADVAATSSPVSVSWYNPIVPPDNFNLTAYPTNVTMPGDTKFTLTFDQSDVNFVNQEFNGTADVVILDDPLDKVVASGTWNTASGMSVILPYTPVGGTSHDYTAFLEDPTKTTPTFLHQPVAVSNAVTVSDTGYGIVGNSYTTTACDGTGDGTEIFYTYVDGKLTKTKTVPLTMTNLEIDGVYNPPAQLVQDVGNITNNTVQMPIVNSRIDGPIPLRVQAPLAFAIQFPNAQPTAVTATFTVNQGDAVDQAGDTSWTVAMHPATNLAYGFWQGETIMPKLPDGVNISIQITASDECGSASTPTGVFPYDNFLTTSGRPQWYFVQPAAPAN